MADPRNPFDFDFAKMMGDLRVPGLDMQSLIESQRRNFEALTRASQQAAEGARAVAERQTAIVREAMEESTRALSALGAAGDPADKAGVQADLVKQAFERNMANLRELSEMVAKTQSESLATLNTRFAAGLDEFKQVVAKAKK